jgi:non-specific serine/threonine protein kinase
VVGGFDVQGRSRAETFVFEGTQWKLGPALPLGLDHLSAATFDNILYVAGGFSNGAASARLFRLDGDHWTELAPLHHARGALALVGADDALWALAGLGPGGEVGPGERYDIAGNSWTDLPAIPRPRDHVAGFGWGQRVCVAGGRSPNTAQVDCLDTATREWTAGPSLPMPTSGAGGGALRNPVVAGGEDPQETRIVNFVARLRGDTWTSEPMLHPRHGIQLAVFHGRLWACGGGEQAGLHPVATCTSIAP